MDIFHEVSFDKMITVHFDNFFYTSDFQECKYFLYSQVAQLEVCHCHREQK